MFENEVEINVQPPRVLNLAIFQTAVAPYYIWKYVAWRADWWYRFEHQKLEYGDAERAYLTRKALWLDEFRFDSIPEEEKSLLISKELWIKKNYEQYLKEQRENANEAYKDSNKYKQYKRFMKKNKWTAFWATPTNEPPQIIVSPDWNCQPKIALVMHAEVVNYI